MKNKLDNDESVLQKMKVKFKNVDTELILTSKRIIFEQEKGLFKKKLRPIYIVLIDNIKMYKEEVKIEQKNKMVVMQTSKGDVSFACDNIVNARKIIEEIINVRTGSSVLDRVTDKTKKVIGNVAKVVGIAGTAAVGVTEISKNKKTILKVAKGIMKLFK